MRAQALLLVMSLVASPAIASGQQFRGTVVGTVTDAAGALLPGARVTLVEVDTNRSVMTETNGEGFYVLDYIPAGRYRLRIAAAGFQPVTVEPVEIRVGDRLTLDQRLSIEPLETTIMVAGDPTPLLQTGSASLGQVVDRRRIEELPLADGNPFVLARLAPGVAFTDVNNLRFTRPFDNGGTSSISANGVGSQTSEFTLDGVPDSAAFGRQVAYVPPAEAVREFKVVTSSFDARHGHSAGAHVEVVTRSGATGPPAPATGSIGTSRSRPTSSS